MHTTFETEVPEGCEACRDLLPWYVADTLASAERDSITAHIESCTRCTRELATLWGLAQMVAAEGRAVRPMFDVDVSWERYSILLQETEQEQGIARSATAGVESMHVTPEAYRAGGMEGAFIAFVRESEHFWRVVVAQMRLLRRGMWVASALGVALAALYAALVPTVSAGNVLTVALPLIAASGAAFLFGPENDPALELALGTPTYAHTVLFGRFLLLFGYDVALALAGTALVAASHSESMWVLASLWFGPMALLSTVSLALSLIVNPLVAGGATAALWLSRLVHLDEGASLRLTPTMLWHTSPQMLAISLGLLLVTLLCASRQEWFARGG